MFFLQVQVELFFHKTLSSMSSENYEKQNKKNRQVIRFTNFKIKVFFSCEQPWVKVQKHSFVTFVDKNPKKLLDKIWKFLPKWEGKPTVIWQQQKPFPMGQERATSSITRFPLQKSVLLCTTENVCVLSNFVCSGFPGQICHIYEKISQKTAFIKKLEFFHDQFLPYLALIEFFDRMCWFD